LLYPAFAAHLCHENEDLVVEDDPHISLGLEEILKAKISMSPFARAAIGR